MAVQNYNNFLQAQKKQLSATPQPTSNVPSPVNTPTPVSTRATPTTPTTPTAPTTQGNVVQAKISNPYDDFLSSQKDYYDKWQKDQLDKLNNSYNQQVGNLNTQYDSAISGLQGQIGDVNNQFNTDKTNAEQAQYDAYQDLAVSATNRGINYSPQALGLETGIRVNTTKAIQEYANLRDQRIKSINDKINSLTSEKNNSLSNLEFNKNNSMTELSGQYNEGMNKLQQMVFEMQNNERMQKEKYERELQAQKELMAENNKKYSSSGGGSYYSGGGYSRGGYSKSSYTPRNVTTANTNIGKEDSYFQTYKQTLSNAYNSIMKNNKLTTDQKVSQYRQIATREQNALKSKGVSSSFIKAMSDVYNEGKGFIQRNSKTSSSSSSKKPTTSSKKPTTSSKKKTTSTSKYYSRERR